jgi:pyridoxamine 5'-phosphate oxidase
VDKPIRLTPRPYRLQRLGEAQADTDPLLQFDRWFDDATKAALIEPNAMTLATANESGRPSARLVLLKGYGAEGFVFYTNRRSRKGRELAVNPYAALCIWWAELERQVRIEGIVSQVSEAESETYFRTRTRESQLGACVSEQSEVIASREALEQRLVELTRRYLGQDVPRPPHWGGYRLIPDEYEFWQGREHRLHDRLRYRRDRNGNWLIERLAP